MDQSSLYQPAMPSFGATDPMAGFRIDPLTGQPAHATYPMGGAGPLAQVGGATGGNQSGMPSAQDKMMMEYMLKMGEFSPQEKAAERKAAMGNMLREEGGDTSGMIDAGRYKVASIPKGVGQIAEKVAGGYLKGKADRDNLAIGESKGSAMKDLASKMGFGGAE